MEGEPVAFNETETWGEVADYWPRRLLHIPTMTSHERSGKSTYRGSDRPRYSILSYTWGRWEVRQVPGRGPVSMPAPLRVEGVPWRIPSIAETHFTAERFQSVINRLGVLGGTEWAWVDIACIDQEDDAVKMDEVGRQASIFKNARTAAIWLSHVPAETMVGVLRLPDTDDISRLWVEIDEHEVLPVMRDISKATASILDDPWFSSLWTLQELTLRPDAFIFCMKGECVKRLGIETDPLFFSRDPGESSKTLPDNDLLSLNRLSSKLEKVIGRTEELCTRKPACPEVQRLASETAERVRRSGLDRGFTYNPNNPNVQISAAKFRKTLYKEDRVYAICQIYNVRIGRSLRPDDRLQSFDNLRKEFGLAINARSALLGQLFVHTEEPSRGMSWCVTENSDVPREFQVVTYDGLDITATIAQDDNGSIIAQGFCCPFQDFYDASLQACSASPEVDEDVGIYFDQHVSRVLQLGPDNWLSSPKLVDCGTRLKDQFESERLWIMLLGTGDDLWPCGVLGPLSALPWGPRASYGLLLHEVDLRVPGTGMAVTYQRLGVCKWTTMQYTRKEGANSQALVSEAIRDYGRRKRADGIPWETVWHSYCQYAREMDRLFSHWRSIRLL
ncbi:hypothetical protein VM1G_06398 [Cytospora mali]|uniref:Heterokaryon incompatibility domain-containing protein n=1 Tax=Cytospora mali TaxID=578113 RepID=A0A194W1T8_CYTMA|nr:hypothetical protein VM1G_06398 [Valsa mali]